MSTRKSETILAILMNSVQREQSRAELEAKFWFEIAHWMVILAAFQYAAKLVPKGSFAAVFMGLATASMNAALVTLLAARLTFYLERASTWVIRKARYFGFIYFDGTVPLLRLATFLFIWLGTLWAISSAITGVIKALPGHD